MKGYLFGDGLVTLAVFIVTQMMYVVGKQHVVEPEEILDALLPPDSLLEFGSPGGLTFYLLRSLSNF